MTAPNIVFMVASLWRLTDEACVQFIIRAAARSIPCFYTINTSPVLHLFALCCNIKKRENAQRLQFEIYNKIQEDMRTESKEKGERSRMRETEMNSQAERNEGDQRHVEFTITLLGCTVIKDKSPQRARRLQACPVSSFAPLISCVSPTET